MKNSDYTDANRAAWNKAAPIHYQHQFEKLMLAFETPGYSCLDEIETRLLYEIGVVGKSVAQLCCNNGRELLSIKNLGAEYCVGFDISEEFIAQAGKLADVAGLNCEFVCSDVYQIPEKYFGEFDVVYISVGVLGWMPDISQFFAVVQKLLRQNGHLLVYEMHPMLDMYEDNQPTCFSHSYFNQVPFADQTGLDYYGHTQYDSPISYWFHHKMSDIINACLNNGLQLQSFHEYDHDISNVFMKLEEQTARPPLSYTLVACKRS